MPDRLTFQHKTVGGYHVITSKELPGLHVTGKTRQEAEAHLKESVDAYMAIRGERRQACTTEMTLFG